MKAKDLKNKTKKELVEFLAETKNKLFLSRIEKSRGQLKNVRMLGHLRKDIARLHGMIKNK